MYSNMPCSYRQGPSLGFVAEAGRLLLWRRLEYDFLACLLLYLASYFSFFVFHFFLFLFFLPASRYVHLLRVPSSVQQPPATLSKYVFYSTCSSCLCHLYPTSSRNSFVFLFVLIITFSIFFVALISRVAFFFLLYLLLSYPVR